MKDDPLLASAIAPDKSATPSPNTALPSARLYNLDALRAFAMIFGVLVHACSLGDLGPYRIIPFLSDHFRMASFFLVSAMLSTAVLAKRSAGAFIRRRLITILLPFFAALILLNPIAVALVMYWHNPTFGFHVIDAFALSFAPPPWVRGPVIWHLHLWFLLSLALYSLIIPTIATLVRDAAPHLERIIRSVPESLRMVLMALMISMLGLLIRAIAQILFPDLLNIWPITATLRYSPYIIAGVMTLTLPSIRSAMERFDPILGILGIFTLFIEMQVDYFPNAWMSRIAEPAAKYVTTFAIVQTLYFIFFVSVKNSNQKLSFIIDSIFTVYLFHYVFIYVFAFIFLPIGLPKGLFLFLVAICALSTGLFIHWGLVSRIPLLKLMFNGVLLPKTR